MKLFKDNAVGFMILTFLLLGGFAKAENLPIPIDLKGGVAKVALLKGNASLSKADKKVAQPLTQGATLSNGDLVTTGKNTRIELKSIN